MLRYAVTNRIVALCLVGLFALSNYCGASELSFDSLKRLIEEKHLTSIEALLPFLPIAFRSKYALVFRSRSLQGSSYQNPRVILYGSDASFEITFNGAPDQLNFNSLETMEFDEKSKEFHFREIQFPDQENSGFRFSAINPEKCLRCHGAKPRPIWDTHPLWPGAYGERYLDPLSPKERAGIEDFLSKQAKHPRYSTLEYPEIFAKKETFVPSTKNRYEGNRRQSPNEELSRFLSKLNAKHIVKLLREAPGFREYQYAILAALDSNCEGLDQYLPDSLKTLFPAQYSTFSASSDRKNQEQELLKRIRAVSLQGQESVKRDSDLVPLHSVRFLAEFGLGISTAEWSTALESDTYDFSSPQSTEAELESLLLPVVASSDLTVDSLASVKQVSSSDKYCSYLRQKSIAALATKAATSFHSLPKQALSTGGGRPVLMGKCISCHQGDEGPAIPFEHPAELAKALGRGSYSHGNLLEEIIYRLSPKAGSDTMPRGLNISNDERSELEEYFRSLKKLSDEKSGAG